MTIAELIAELQKYDQSWEVLTEGCDCVADATGVTSGENWMSATTVMITRDGGM